MEKKFLGKVLMMASFVAILGCFSSCDDNSEDNYSDLLNKLETQYASLEDALDAQKKSLLEKLAELEAAQQQCKRECSEKMAVLDAKIGALDGKIEQLNQMWETEFSELATQIANLKAEDQILAAKIESLNSVIGDASALGGKTIVEQIVELNKLAAQVNDSIVAWSPRLSNVEKEAAEAKELATKNQIAIAELTKLAAQYGVSIEALTSTVNSLNNSLNSLTNDVASLGVGLDSLANALNSGLAALDGNIGSLGNSLDSLANALNGSLAALSGNVDSLGSAMTDSLLAINVKLAIIQAQADKNLEEAKDYTNAQVELLKGEVLDSVSQLVKALQAADRVLASRLDAVEARVGALNSLVAKNTKDIENLTGALKKLVTSVVLQGTKNPVTGSIATPYNTRSNILAAYYGSVESQGLEFPTSRPRFYVDAANVQLTSQDIKILGAKSVTKDAGVVLLGDEGNAGTLYMTINPNTVDFTGLNVALVNSQDEFSGATLSAPVPSDEVLSFGMTRAAKNGFYESKATINEKNLEDVKLTLNFNDVKEVAKDFVNGNGFNVTQLANTVANTMNSLVMDANGVKVSWQDYEGEHSTYSQYGVAVTAIKPLSFSFGMDFNYTKAPGVEQVENFIGKMVDKTVDKLNSIMPDFSSMSFSVPTIKKIQIDELNPDSFKITINIVDTVEYELNMDIKIDDVVVNSVNGQTQSIIVTVPEKTHHIYNATLGSYEDITIPAYTITVPSSNFVVDGQVVHINDVKVQKVLEIPISFTHVEDIYPIINDLYGSIVGSIEDVNDMLGELESFMDDVNKMLDELNKIKDITAKVEDASNALKGQISNFLDKFNDKFCSVINSTNKVLRPVMFVNTDKGIVKLSQAKNNPTVITGTTLSLVPTSYSMEYIAPAYKKLVGVTNVFKGSANAQAGDAACLAALKKVNAQTGVAEVLAGDTYNVNVTFETGYVYEVVYTAVDFFGMVDAKKFYVTVK